MIINKLSRRFVYLFFIILPSLAFLMCGDVDFFEKTLRVDNALHMDKGDTLINGIICVPVPGGTFNMGSPPSEAGRYPDEVQVSVTVGKFWISKYPITNRQYAAVFPQKAYPVAMVNYPVTGVSWHDAAAFAEAKRGALPTEAQWEFAARGGAAATAPYYVYSGGNDSNAVAWYVRNSNGRVREVGLKLPNALGIYDMSGNVYEWIADWYSVREAASAPPRPPLAGNGVGRLHKGGGYRSPARDCRVADRAHSLPGERSDDIGFRIVFE